MLCSSCSKPVRPVVAIDIDGTLGRYHDHFFQFMCGYVGISPVPDDYQGGEHYRDYITRKFGVSVGYFRNAKLAYRQGGLKRTMPLNHYAKQLMCDLQPHCELWVTTTRPYLRLDAIDPDTREWLTRHGIVYDSLLYHDDKYRVLAEQVDVRRVVAVVDDLLENLMGAGELFGDHIPIQYATRYNRAERITPHADDLQHISRTVLKRIRDWEEIVHDA